MQKHLVKIESNKMNYYFHLLSVNLNFENPLRIIENYTRGGGGNKKNLDGNMGGGVNFVKK